MIYIDNNTYKYDLFTIYPIFTNIMDISKLRDKIKTKMRQLKTKLPIGIGQYEAVDIYTPLLKTYGILISSAFA